jgi:integrase
MKPRRPTPWISSWRSQSLAPLHAIVWTVNPARSVTRRREDNSRVRYLTEDEEKRLCAVLELEYQRHLPEFDLALNTGLRQGSQYSLTWSMVDWKQRMVHIPRTKNEHPLHVPLNEAALAALRIACSRNGANGRVFLSERTGEPLVHPRHWFDPALRKAKIAEFRWHDLRHTFASRLRMKGTPLEDIADLLGHKSLMMTRRYAHLGPNHLHETVARLTNPALNPAPTQPESQADKRQHYVN